MLLPELQALLHNLWQSALTSPVWAFCLIFAVACCITRAITEFTTVSNNGGAVKKVDVLPYWIPFLGHVPSLFKLNAALLAAR